MANVGKYIPYMDPMGISWKIFLVLPVTFDRRNHASKVRDSSSIIHYLVDVFSISSGAAKSFINSIIGIIVAGYENLNYQPAFHGTDWMFFLISHNMQKSKILVLKVSAVEFFLLLCSWRDISANQLPKCCRNLKREKRQYLHV